MSANFLQTITLYGTDLKSLGIAIHQHRINPALPSPHTAPLPIHCPPPHTLPPQITPPFLHGPLHSLPPPLWLLMPPLLLNLLHPLPQHPTTVYTNSTTYPPPLPEPCRHLTHLVPLPPYPTAPHTPPLPPRCRLQSIRPRPLYILRGPTPLPCCVRPGFHQLPQRLPL